MNVKPGGSTPPGPVNEPSALSGHKSHAPADSKRQEHLAKSLDPFVNEDINASKDTTKILEAPAIHFHLVSGHGRGQV